MYIKQLLSLATIAGASAANSHNLRHNNERILQASIGCIIGGKEFTECCPSANPRDGFCTLIWCIDVDEVALNNACGCGQIERACGQLRIYAFLLPGLSDMCSQVRDCCDDGTTTNDGVNTCMTTAFEVTVPNFESIIPGGIPDLEGVGDDSTEAIDSLAATDEDMSMRLTF
mmetsp:Transcript_29960/g.55357  ORF Transcript_29960/g.55357 Transcript_29960/m.55357 type:complete len:172 (+) Transcript_29960:85-600(+)